MAAHVLVVATVTATSDDLLAALKARADRGSVPVDFTLVMPASGPDTPAMEPRLAETLERWEQEGLRATGVIGDADPARAPGDRAAQRDGVPRAAHERARGQAAVNSSRLPHGSLA